jgi:hypothetical protein
MDWTAGLHRRKFVEIAGECRKQEEQREGTLRFWTEWEPESNVTEIANPLENGPRFVHRPYYVRPDSYRDEQNTDPFVFGSSFFYMGCQQNTRRGPTQLRYLDRGSVILFGSRVGGQFAIDTVFVVERWQDHNATNYRELLKHLPETYGDVTFQAWYKDHGGTGCRDECATDSCRLYWGATFENPVDGMFSFFPCMPAEDSRRGFARPVVEIPGVITNDLQQGKRLNARLSQKKVVQYWGRVRHTVEAKGLWLGLHAHLPRRRGGNR